LSPDIASAAAQKFGAGYSPRQNGCSGQTGMFMAFWQEMLTKNLVVSWVVCSGFVSYFVVRLSGSTLLKKALACKAKAAEFGLIKAKALHHS